MASLTGLIAGAVLAIVFLATPAASTHEIDHRYLVSVLGVPVAAGLLYPVFGLLLSPMIASAAMSLRSVSAIANALRRVELRRRS